MKYAINLIFSGSLAALCVFIAAELVHPGSVSNFIAFSLIFVVIFVLAIGSLIYPVKAKERVHPIVIGALTLALLGGTILFTHRSIKDLGKIGLIVVIGATVVAAATLKKLFERYE